MALSDVEALSGGARGIFAMTVEPFEKKDAKNKRLPKEEKWLRRQALQVVAQLPDCEKDALAVLDYARELVRFYVAPSRPA